MESYRETIGCEDMGQYIYLGFTKFAKKGIEKDPEYWRNTWIPKHAEVCKEHNVTCHKIGIPFGTVEEWLFIYETDLPLAEYQTFRGAVMGISDERLFSYTKTTIVNCPI